MPDDRKWRLGVVQFQALRSNVPRLIPQKLVEEYHAILDLLAAASDEDLNSFRIPTDDLKPRVTGAVMGSDLLPYSGRTLYSDDNYCNKELFSRKVDGLHRYLPELESRFKPASPSAPSAKDYYHMSDEELENLAIEYQFTGYGNANGPAINRDMIIKKLHARDRAIREANVARGNSINIGTMVGSTIQQQSPAAHATTRINVADLNEILKKVGDALPQLHLAASDEKEIKSDVATVELQVNSGKPKPAIIRECLISMRGILEKSAGTLISSGALEMIEQFLKHHRF